MRKVISLALSVMLVFTAFIGMSMITFAEGETDAVTTATTYTEGTQTPGTVSPGKWMETVVYPEGAELYTVKSGDVAWKIAKAYGLTLDDMKKLNPNVKNLNMIYAGQKLVVKMGEAPMMVDNTLYHGIGNQTNFRARGENYSANIAMASVIFDAQGKIVSCYIDTYEVTQSENFAGWPGMTADITLDSATAQVAAWETKRERGNDYGMAAKATTGNEWFTQLDYYQKFFVGKTVAELREWFDKSTGSTGKPINPATAEKEDELAKLAKLTEAEKAVLVDVVASATMSLSDGHAKILEAVEEAYQNRVPMTVPNK